MDEYSKQEIHLTLKRFNSTADDQYDDAMRVYTRNIAGVAKTNTDEISYWLDNSHRMLPRIKFMIFGFLNNDNVIGFAELGYFCSERVIMLDYLVIDKKFMSLSNYYSFLIMILDYLDICGIDYDYIVTEILERYNHKEVESDTILLLENASFKVINSLYIQPGLAQNNVESNKEALLMIYQRNGNQTSIRKDTYLNIVHTIYFTYYYEWDKTFIKDEESRIKIYQKLEDDYKKIKESLNIEVKHGDSITLNEYMNKIISNGSVVTPNSTRTIRNAIGYTFIIAMGIMLILFFLKEWNIERATIIAVSLVVLSIILCFIYIADPRVVKILEKIPIISKIMNVLSK
jgi:hypothetical protein